MLASLPGGRGFLEAGQVNGNFAVFTQSRTGTAFNVWLYNIAQKTLTVIPNPLGKMHTAAAVNPFGTVYFEQSGGGCGRNATVEEYPVGGPMSAAGTLKPGIDLFHPFLFENGSLDSFLFAKIHCRGGGIDIYKTLVLLAVGAGDGALAGRRDQRCVLGEHAAGVAAAAAASSRAGGRRSRRRRARPATRGR